MILTDQPKIFPDELQVHFSSRDDGTMLMREFGRHAPEAVENRRAFLEKNSIDYDDMVYQTISYAPGGSYNTLAIVDKRHRMLVDPGTVADALITDQPGIALFLPVADCVATVLYDPHRRVLAVLHLGRHSSITDLISRVISTMETLYGTQVVDLLAYLSPAIQRESYKLEHFDQAEKPEWLNFVDEKDDGIYVDLPGYNHHVLVKLGVPAENIELSTLDVFVHSGYFSHARGDKNGRQALVAMMK